MSEIAKKRFDVLCIMPQDKPVYLLVPAVGFEDEHGVSAAEYAEHFYESKACPSDTLRSVDTVIIEGDADPHGLIEYVGTTEEIEFPDGGYKPAELLPKIVPEAFA